MQVTKKCGLTELEWDTCWMAIRYAMGRRTIASSMLPVALLREYNDRWTEVQRKSIVRDLRNYLEAFNDDKKAFFGDEKIDHPVWAKFLYTLDEDTHCHVTVEYEGRQEVLECIRYDDNYYVVSGEHNWWNSVGFPYLNKDVIVKVDEKE